jgi:hypothetical protein
MQSTHRFLIGMKRSRHVPSYVSVGVTARKVETRKLNKHGEGNNVPAIIQQTNRAASTNAVLPSLSFASTFVQLLPSRDLIKSKLPNNNIKMSNQPMQQALITISSGIELNQTNMNQKHNNAASRTYNRNRSPLTRMFCCKEDVKKLTENKNAYTCFKQFRCGVVFHLLYIQLC